jgi:mannose-6-phosphate isomerase-like protein (cupin superfamily)
MAEKHSPAENPAAAEHYYDYEARFIKQKREQERINILPRVIKPAMFAKGEFALGDPRVFSRYTVAPLSALTCSFVELGADGDTAPRRMIPSVVAYIVAGSGACFQDGVKVEFAAGDVVLTPPYTTYHFSADPKSGFRAWLPQLRLWHGQGLLWRDPFGARKSDDEKDLTSEQEVAEIFRSRRQVREPVPGKTRYDWFLSRLADENRVEREGLRVIRAADRAWEETRQGKIKFYLHRWMDAAARGLDLMVQEIAPGEHSGEHRHIFEELLLVVKGRGYDLHESTRHPWEAGDLICVPPMIAHQHVNDGADVAHLISVWPQQPGHELLGGIEQIGNASDWKR